MKAIRLLAVATVLAALPAVSGCLVPRAELTACQLQNQTLSEQCRAQLAEIENLKVHSRTSDTRLIDAEQELARLEDEIGLDQRQLANYQRERAGLHEQFKGLANGRGYVPPQVNAQLVELSERYPSFRFDPATGVSKLDTDVLFETGDAELKPEAARMIADLTRVLKSPEASDLKIMIVGHTDNQQIATRPTRENYPNNFHLSSARAIAVADQMRRQGLPEQRMGVAGLGSHQPIAPNATAEDRRKNRRVEIFVMGPDVPIVGWTDSMPSVY